MSTIESDIKHRNLLEPLYNSSEMGIYMGRAVVDSITAAELVHRNINHHD